jgi:hypothetical protein
MYSIFSYKPAFIIALILLFFNFNNADSIAFKSISKLNPDTTRIAAVNQPPINVQYAGNPTPLKNMFGINAYEWNFLENPASPNDRKHIYEDNMALIKTFSAVRHYLNWDRIESIKGDYTFNPVFNGNYNFDIIYQRCKQEGILVLADIKNCPLWMANAYPVGMRDNENAPAPFGLSLNNPASYIDQAHVAFQFAARYGYNKNIDPKLIKTDTHKRYPDDIPNQPLVGMALISYIECGNERDRWWGNEETHQTAELYAATCLHFMMAIWASLGPVQVLKPPTLICR